MILMVLSLRDAVIDSSLQVPRSLNADVFVLSPRTQTVMRPAPFPRRFLDRLRSVPNVEAVSSVSIENGRWVNPTTRLEHPIRVFGLELEFGVLSLPGIDPNEPRLKMKDYVLFDASSRPKFGNVAEAIHAGESFSTEVNGRRIEVCGLTYSGVSIASDGNIFTTPANFQRLFPKQGTANSHIGIIRAKDRSGAKQIAIEIQAMLGNEAQVLTKGELLANENEYMRVNDPVDDIMGMIGAVAFLVGMIIVYQILYSDVINHLPQFATLKAIGFNNSFLLGIILSEGLILALIGFWPGLAIANGLSQLAESATSLPVSVSSSNSIFVFVASLVMCGLAAAIAVRKIAQVEPASVF